MKLRKNTKDYKRLGYYIISNNTKPNWIIKVHAIKDNRMDASDIYVTDPHENCWKSCDYKNININMEYYINDRSYRKWISRETLESMMFLEQI
jgi:hypothetical protein